MVPPDVFDASLLLFLSLHTNLSNIIDCSDNDIILIKYNDEKYKKKSKLKAINILKNIMNCNIEFISWYNGVDYKIGIILKYENSFYINILPCDVYYELKAKNIYYNDNFPLFKFM